MQYSQCSCHFSFRSDFSFAFIQRCSKAQLRGKNTEKFGTVCHQLHFLPTVVRLSRQKTDNEWLSSVLILVLECLESENAENNRKENKAPAKIKTKTCQESRKKLRSEKSERKKHLIHSRYHLTHWNSIYSNSDFGARLDFQICEEIRRDL